MSTAPLIHTKLIACLRDIEAIGKNSKNQQQGFAYRGIDAVYNALNPILAKHGVFTAPEVVSVQREERQTKSGSNLLYSIVTMKHNFFAEDGSCVSTTVVGEGMDSGDKATNKAMAIAHKYALFQIFCIPTEDMADPDAHAHEVAPKGKVETYTGKPTIGTPVARSPEFQPMNPDTEKQIRFFVGVPKARTLIEKVLATKELLSVDDFSEELAVKTISWIESELKKETK